MLEIRLLGQFDLKVAGQTVALASRPAQSLLAYLAMQAGVAHRREKLAALLWPDTDEIAARKNLRQALWQARKALGSPNGGATPYLLADDLTVAFNHGAEFWLDVAVLEGASQGQCSAEELMAAVAAYRGELLPGFYDDWAVLERERLEAVLDRVMQALLDRLLAEARWPEVLAWAERWIALGHVPEPAYRALMQAHAAQGDVAAAVTTYQRCRTALHDQLGVEPSASTRSVYAELSQRRLVARPPAAGAAAQTAGRVPEPAPAAGPPPFQGLRCFEAEDAGRFFGREALTHKLAGRLAAGESLLFVVGASGSGKSSLVRAGLIPALVEDAAAGANGAVGMRFAWRPHVLTPTAHPLQALAVSLARDAESMAAVAHLMDDFAREPRSLRLMAGRLAGAEDRAGGRKPRLLLVVDQFEELFTLCRDEAERGAFIENLLGAADGVAPVALVITLRADFYGHCSAYPELRHALASRQEYIGPMSAEELRRAIEEPARAGGWDFEPGVVDLILRDVGDEPGGLPLLSHALLETWRRRAGRTLTLASYANAGGVHGALARTAERFYQGLSAADQELLRGIFLRLTELGEGTQDTRRRVALAELAPGPALELAVAAITEGLAQARLITVDDGTAEVAHEALIREWPRLRGWLAADREGLRLHRRLTEAAAAWAGLDRDPGELYRGARLAQAGEWAAGHAGDINPLEREFLEASAAQTEREAAEEEARRRRELAAARRLAETEHRTAQQLRRRAIWLSAALVLAAGLAAAALLFGRQAQEQARIARDREWAAAAVANLAVDPERSVLLAVQAVSDTHRAGGAVLPEALDALHRALPEARTRFTLAGHKGPIRNLAVSPDGRQLATLGKDGYLKLWNTADGQSIRSTNVHPHEGGFDVAYSHDGKLVATASRYEGVRIWSVASGQELQNVQYEDNRWGTTASMASGLSFSPDDRRLAVANADGAVRIYDPVDGHLWLEIDHRGSDGQSPAAARDVTFSPDGKLLAVAYAFPSVPDFGAGLVQVYDASTGRQAQVLTSHVVEVNVNRLNFSPDGSLLATADDNHVAKLWDVASGKLLRTFTGHTAEVEEAAFSPDGTQLATASLDGTARLWDVASGRELLSLAGHSGGVLAVAFVPSAGGPRLATASADGTARIWDLGPAREWLTLGAGQLGGIGGLAFSPDCRRLAAMGERGLAAVWDMPAGRQTFTISLKESGERIPLNQLPANLVAYSPDGKQLALSASSNRVDINARVTLHDAASGQLLTTIDDLALGTTRSMTFSPDGVHLLTGNFEKVAGTWDPATGRRQQILAGHSGPVNSVAYSPDGAHIATGSDDGQVKLWDAATGLAQLTLNDAHVGSVWSVAFSPDGKRLATAGRDGTAKIWDLATRSVQLTLAGHIADVRSVAWSPDGKLLATGSGDTTAKVWDAATGAELYTLRGHTDLVSVVAFSPDGTRLATAGDDGTVRLYLLHVDDLLALAKGRVTRALAADECRKYLHLATCPASD